MSFHFPFWFWAIILLVPFILLFNLLGCTPHRALRVVPEEGKPFPPLSQSAVLEEKGNKSKVYIVEFDDQGETWGSSERDFVLQEINKIESDAKDSSKPPEEKSPITVLVFVHGWHHNASDKDSNLKSFRKVLEEFANRPDFGLRRWIGVYIGWRGESISVPGLNYLTFWDRRSAAERVGGIPLANFLADLGDVVGTRDENMLIAIGHSFGARVLETAVTNALPFNGGKSKLDLVVLLNEASEGLRAKMAIDAFKQETAHTPVEKAPQIISITSVGDGATGFWFPIGQFFLAMGNVFQDYQKYSNPQAKTLPNQSKLFKHTAGHLDALCSHTVVDTSELAKGTRPDVMLFSTEGILSSNLNRLLVPRQGVYNEGTPYWIFQVPKNISFGHNDIFNKPLSSLLASIVEKWFPDPAIVKSERRLIRKN